MTIEYLLTPFLAWLVAGSLKFVVNFFSSKSAISLIGYGGFPSNHSAIVTSTTTLIALKESIAHPAFGVAITLSFVVMLDAASLRRQIGRHAVAINQLNPDKDSLLRERIGHTLTEIFGGIFVGIACGFLVFGLSTCFAEI